MMLFPFIKTLSQNLDQVQALPVVTKMIVEKPEFASCHASTIVELPGGRLMAAWFAGPEESNPKVAIWMSVQDLGKWQKPQVIADGIVSSSVRYACWNPVLFRTKAGRLFLFYKVGKSPREWWGMMKYSNNDGQSWSVAEKLPGGMLGPIKNKPIQLQDGNILHPSSTESKDGDRWKIHIERSDPRVHDWIRVPIDCDTFEVIQPAILIHDNNRLQLLSRSRHGHIVEAWSSDNGNSWSKLTKTNLPNPNSGIDAVTLKNKMHLLVYNPIARGRNKLNVAVSVDGIRWRNVFVLEDQQGGEFSYPAVIQSKDELVHITYTYNRKNIKHVALRILKDVNKKQP